MMTNEQVLEKMEEDFILRNLSARTRQSYRYDINQFFKFTKKQLLYDINQNDLRSYLLCLRGNDKIVTLTTSNQYNSACKFLLQTVLGMSIDFRQVPNARAKHKLQRPFLISELEKFFSNITDGKRYK